ncbi:hypothetical protein GWA01_19460 [Gluconobacter wancherniae NBRC 103581]|uniref:Uncharacterized protein n=1 Tax=Gluconobacter wancherniae NBRC 103581 TaxID=656744 RepID=A0A511B146_9PROT|nr:hypothetical protein AA103581_1647 [Gluconobacter wancherniae NBRC 103581]GEK94176.1 hypothetical protein GWA01_19460 [Gluconobacter wancherniae NBRC 103581]
MPVREERALPAALLAVVLLDVVAAAAALFWAAADAFASRDKEDIELEDVAETISDKP